MAVGTGYSKIATSGSVFVYDTGDTFNSYKGEPTTNYWNGNQFSIYNDGATNIRNSTDVAPPVPGYEVVKVTANNIGSYGQCILWNATYPNNNVATITNSIYAYLTVGDYVQVGQHWWPWYYGTQKAIPKNQWVRISETYTINEGNSYGNAALTYSTNGIAYFAMPQFEYVSHVTPFIGANQTRSNTQGLLDISGRGNTVTLANMSYDGNAQPFFDGTDDYTQIVNGMNPLVGTNQVTFAAWIYRTSAPSYWAGVISNKVNLTDGISLLINPSSKIFWQYDSTSGVYAIDGGATLATGVWYYIVGVYDNVGLKTYLNGVLNDSANDAGKSIASNGSMNINIGAQEYLGSPASYFPGRIAIAQIYNRALSPSEILSNFNHYKTRFNIT